MAANGGHQLRQHYGRLRASTQRLSSGLRINSRRRRRGRPCIRELQRADIAACAPGRALNANDAISMIQVADGALGVIDEKTHPHEGACRTGRHRHLQLTQRLMIESEYQAMAERNHPYRQRHGLQRHPNCLTARFRHDKHDGSGLVSTGRDENPLRHGQRLPQKTITTSPSAAVRPPRWALARFGLCWYRKIRSFRTKTTHEKMAPKWSSQADDRYVDAANDTVVQEVTATTLTEAKQAADGSEALYIIIMMALVGSSLLEHQQRHLPSDAEIAAFPQAKDDANGNCTCG